MTTNSNLTLGRGKVYFDLYAPGTQTLTGRRYLGNTPEFSLNVAATQLDHFNSDQGLKVKDESVILQLDRKGVFTTDNVSQENMAMFLIGDKSIQAQSALTAQTTTILAAKLDRYYQVGATAANPSGVRDLTTVTIATTAGSPVSLVLNTDYTIDLTLGLLYIMPTSIVVVDGTTGLTVTYATSATTRTQIVTSAISQVNGALSFVGYNPKGLQLDYFMPYVLLTPNGAFALKGDAWQLVPFNLEVLQLNAATAHIYVDGRPLT